ncbi:MAG: FAD-dependent oxidoreductase [Pseudomonadota bacterium]|nr:FAD-dependent oxidoreductase [Pseudomonadota bacterium]
MEKFDVIVVGAGLAGLAAAHALADRGVECLVLERGDYPGSKNVTGGRIYVNPVRDLFPDLWPDAPLERFIVHEGVTLMAKERSVSFGYSGDELRTAPHQSYSVLRARFDRWLAERVEEKGAMLLTKTLVTDVLREGGRVAGVVAGGDELRADVVVAADGVLSLTAERAGLHPPLTPREYAVGVKEVIALPAEKIADRFQLTGNEGAARLFVGAATAGLFGGGFLYTNRESVSLGLVIGIAEFLEQDPPRDLPVLMEDFKRRPEIAPLIRDGVTVEYAAHMIPEGGFRGLQPLYGDGMLVVGDAAGFALNLGFTVRGMEYALASGYYAAQAILKAREAGDYGAETLAEYGRLLQESFVLKDFQSFQAAPAFVKNPRFFGHYPEFMGRLLRDIHAVPGGPKDRLYPTLRGHLHLRELWSMFKDFREVTKL